MVELMVAQQRSEPDCQWQGFARLLPTGYFDTLKLIAYGSCSSSLVFCGDGLGAIIVDKHHVGILPT
jgi:hypothetical protein